MAEAQNSTPMTLGQIRVRATFNPSEDKDVAEIKTKVAELIDFCEKLKQNDPRLASLAQTALEEAAMWAVKAATTPVSPETTKAA